MDSNKTTVGFPDPLEKDSIKKTNAYGLKIAKAIEQDWFNGGVSNSGNEYQARKQWIEENRLFFRGEQDVSRDKEHVSRNEGDLDYINLDWTTINLVSKFCYIVANGISDKRYRLEVRAIDKLSSNMKKQKEAYYKKQMRAKQLYNNAKKQLGIDLRPKGFVPEDEEEMALYMEIKEKPKAEIAEELMLEYVNRVNDHEALEKLKNLDLVLNGIAVQRVWTDPNDGIKKGYVDPEYFGHSQVTRNDFSDAYYFFEVDSVTITDIQREAGFDDDTLRKIAKQYASKNDWMSPSNFNTVTIDEIANIRVDVIRFTYKTSKSLVYKKSIKKGNRIKVSKRDDSFEPPQRNDYGRIDQVLDTWYEGSYVVGTPYLYNYQECENVERDEMNKALPPYRVVATDIYKNRLRSFLSDLKPISKQIQYIHLKMQQLIAELKPDLIEIDIDQLAELGDGKGGSKRDDWKEALNILNVKGVVLKKRIDMGEMGIKEGNAATPRASQQGSALGALLNSWAHYYNLMRDISGVNPVRDGSQPSDSLVGTNQMALLASNTATQHIVDCATYMNKKVAETISSRIHGIFSNKDAKHLQKLYERAVGKHNLEALEALKDRSLHDFGFTIEILPSNEEMQTFREDLNIAMKEGYIDVEDKMEAESLAKNNYKQAREYLKYRRRKRMKQRNEEEQQRFKMQAQSNAQSAMASEQAKSQSYAQQAQIDVQKAQKLAQLEMLKEEFKSKLKGRENAQDFQYDAYLKKLEVAGTMNLNTFKEDRKDDRLKLQSTHQSKMIDQRKKESEPIEFDDTFDFNSGFSLS